MRIGIDVDGVLADFHTPFYTALIQTSGRDLFPRPFACDHWHYAQKCGYTDEEVDKAWQSIWADPMFWQTLPPYNETANALAVLSERRRQGDDIYFITNRTSKSGVSAKLQTEEWFRNWGYHNPTVLIAERKGPIAWALGLDVYIDDKYENAVDVSGGVGPFGFEPSKTRTFLLNQSWNVDYKVNQYITRVDTIAEFFAAIDTPATPAPATTL